MRMRGKEGWLLAALVLLFFHRPLTSGTFYFRDLFQYFYPKKLLLVHALRSGEIPLWDPFTHGGEPYIAAANHGFYHPMNVLYLFLPAIAAFNLDIVLEFVLCALGACLLARRIGLSGAAAFASGVVFALAGPTLSASNLNHIHGLAAIPFAILFTDIAMRDRRAVAFIGAAFAVAWPLLAGALEVAIFTVLTLALWIAAMPIDGVSRRRQTLLAALIIVFGIGLSLAQIVPALEVVANSSRARPRTYESFTAWSVDPRRMPEMIVPQFFGEPDKLDDRWYWGRRLESEGFPYTISIYFGALALLLAARGAFVKLEGVRVPRRTLALLTAAAILLSLGRWLPFFRTIYDVIPFASRFRFPVKTLILATLPIALLAGCGIESLIRERSRRFALTIGAVSVALLAIAFAFASSDAFASAFSRFFFQQPMTSEVRAALGSQLWQPGVILLAAALALARESPRVMPAILAAILFADLALAGHSVNFYAPRQLFSEPSLVKSVRAAIDGGRFYHGADPPDGLSLRAPSDDLFWLARWRLETLSGYTAAAFAIPVIYHVDYNGLAPERIATLSDVVGRLSWPRRLPLLQTGGVRAFVAHDLLQIPGVSNLGPVRSAEAHPLWLYAIPASAAARFISRVERVSAANDAIRRIIVNGADTITTDDQNPQSGCGSAPVSVIRRALNQSEWSVDAPCRGFVFFSETWYPGWKVFVDGAERPLVRANYAFSAVAVEAGRHTITKRYTPRLPLIGAIASLIALLALIAASRAASAARP